jgi:hypothetical protein
MTHSQRLLHAANQAELAACLSAVAATERPDPLSRSAIRSGLVASRKNTRARSLRQQAEDMERSRDREMQSRAGMRKFYRAGGAL